jgi:hypothetical protein
LCEAAPVARIVGNAVEAVVGWRNELIAITRRDTGVSLNDIGQTAAKIAVGKNIIAQIASAKTPAIGNILRKSRHCKDYYTGYK